MNDSKSDPFDPQVKAWLESGKPPDDHVMEQQRITVVHRARSSIGQRDTVVFAFIKVWTVLADLLAPLFASIATKKAMSMHSKTMKHSTKK